MLWADWAPGPICHIKEMDNWVPDRWPQTLGPRDPIVRLEIGTHTQISARFW